MSQEELLGVLQALEAPVSLYTVRLIIILGNRLLLFIPLPQLFPFYHIPATQKEKFFARRGFLQSSMSFKIIVYSLQLSRLMISASPCFHLQHAVKHYHMLLRSEKGNFRRKVYRTLFHDLKIQCSVALRSNKIFGKTIVCLAHCNRKYFYPAFFGMYKMFRNFTVPFCLFEQMRWNFGFLSLPL